MSASRTTPGRSPTTAPQPCAVWAPCADERPVGGIGEGASREIDAHRVEAFSDGVMAVIITIMAFDLKTPATPVLQARPPDRPAARLHPQLHRDRDLLEQPPPPLASDRADQRRVMWTNLHLLFWLSLLPFATAWVGTAHARPLPAATYGAVALGAAPAYSCSSGDPSREPRRRVPRGRNRYGRQGHGLPGDLRSPGSAWRSSARTGRTPATRRSRRLWFVPDRRLTPVR